MRNFFVVMFLLFMLLGCTQPDKAKEKLALAGGRDVSLAQLSGRWVVVTYWASWNKACQPNLAMLNRLSHLAPKRIWVFAYNYMDLHGAELQKAMAAAHVEFPAFKYLPADWLGLPAEVRRLPATFVLDPRGHLVASFYGAQHFATVRRTIKLA